MASQQKAIHWLTGQFRDADNESRYRDSVQASVRIESRLALILVSLVFAMFGITECFMLASVRAGIVW